MDVFHNKITYIVNRALPIKLESIAREVIIGLFDFGRQQWFMLDDSEQVTIGKSETGYGFAGM